MQNINPYPKDIFQQEFVETEIYQNLVQDFDIISFDKNLCDLYPYTSTPREAIGSKKLTTTFSAVSFYYLGYLLDNSPTQIHDLGCGWNIFKKYIPNIIGVGAEDPTSQSFFADIHDFVDDKYVAGHKDTFESVFSICALHFHPASKFSKIVSDFYSMIKPGGRGFLSLNSARLIDFDHLFFKSTAEQIDCFYRDKLSLLTEINFLVVDIDLNTLDDFVDGNIRLVMEKPKD